MLDVKRIYPGIVSIIGLAALAAMTACNDSRPTDPVVERIDLAKGGKQGGGPKVEETDPTWAEQDTTLDVRVLGSGYDDGSEATFTIDGVADPTKVKTNSTRFVGPKELVANITIALDADTVLYDVEVVTRRGKKGIGADLFRVVEKGSGDPGGTTPLRDVDVSIADTVSTGLTNYLKGDTLGLYVGSDRNHLENGECGVVAQAGGTFSFFPFYGGMNKKQLRNFERRAECGRNPDGSAVRRFVTINLADAKVHKICASDGDDFVVCENDDPTNHDGEETLGERIAAGTSDPIIGADTVRNIHLAFFDTPDGLSRGGFTMAYCGGLGFEDEGTWGLYALRVDNSDPSRVHVETQAGPDRNVGSCGHYDTKYDGNPDTQTPLVLLLHVDIAYDVMEKP